MSFYACTPIMEINKKLPKRGYFEVHNTIQQFWIKCQIYYIPDGKLKKDTILWLENAFTLLRKLISHSVGHIILETIILF